MTAPTLRECEEVLREAEDYIEARRRSGEHNPVLQSIRALLARMKQEHDWIDRFGLTCCSKCGFVRRADDKTSPCRGVVKVGLREPAPPQEIVTEEMRSELRKFHRDSCYPEATDIEVDEALKRLLAVIAQRYRALASSLDEQKP